MDAPRWPPGFVGSLAHDREFAVATVAPAASILGVGIDVEPRLPLPEELLNIIATPGERAQLKGDLVFARLLFCMKEAVYKATNPIDGVFLEHHDVEVCFGSFRRLHQFWAKVAEFHIISRPRLVGLANVDIVMLACSASH